MSMPTPQQSLYYGTHSQQYFQQNTFETPYQFHGSPLMPVNVMQQYRVLPIKSPLNGSMFDCRNIDMTASTAMFLTQTKRPKNSQRKFTDYEINLLEKIFQTNGGFTTPQKQKQIAHDFNVSESKVKSWFYNRRMKQRRQIVERSTFVAFNVAPETKVVQRSNKFNLNRSLSIESVSSHSSYSSYSSIPSPDQWIDQSVKQFMCNFPECGKCFNTENGLRGHTMNHEKRKNRWQLNRDEQNGQYKKRIPAPESVQPITYTSKSPQSISTFSPPSKSTNELGMLSQPLYENLMKYCDNDVPTCEYVPDTLRNFYQPHYKTNQQFHVFDSTNSQLYPSCDNNVPMRMQQITSNPQETQPAMTQPISDNLNDVNPSLYELIDDGDLQDLIGLIKTYEYSTNEPDIFNSILNEDNSSGTPDKPLNLTTYWQDFDCDDPKFFNI